MAATDKIFLTVAEAGELLGVASEKVLRWIASGDLRAVNVAQKITTRARWRIKREDLDSFIASRSTTPRPKSPPRQRRTPDHVTEYY